MVNQHKYISNKQSYAYIRRTSDRLCKEHGLSVVKPGQSKGKSYAEWDAQRKGTSWKAKLKAAIDAAIPQAKDFDDFLQLMQAQGYKIKQGKFISFRAPPTGTLHPLQDAGGILHRRSDQRAYQRPRYHQSAQRTQGNLSAD